MGWLLGELEAFVGDGYVEDGEEGRIERVDEAGVVGDQDAIVFVVEGDVGRVDPRDVGRGGVAPLFLSIGEEHADFAGAGEGDVELAVVGEGDAVRTGEAGGRRRVDVEFGELRGGGLGNEREAEDCAGEVVANGDGDVEALALLVDANAVDAEGEVDVAGETGVGEPELGGAAAGGDFVDGGLEGVGYVEIPLVVKGQIVEQRGLDRGKVA